uniref:CSON001740 protein n=1 Tax=Culicoides sonorensis TaxID=179676 RepID=A0A336MHE7_CULSO
MIPIQLHNRHMNEFWSPNQGQHTSKGVLELKSYKLKSCIDSELIPSQFVISIFSMIDLSKVLLKSKKWSNVPFDSSTESTLDFAHVQCLFTKNVGNVVNLQEI